jgi:DNA polymerase (family 10)
MLNHYEIAQVFDLIADLLQIKGELVYKTLAYRRAADSLRNLPTDLTTHWQAGTLAEIPGVGKALADKIAELLSTGQLQFLRDLEQTYPRSLAILLQIPDLGPKKVKLLFEQCKICTVAELQAAAQAQQLRTLPGFGAKSEEKILAGILAWQQRTPRALLGTAWDFARELLAYFAPLPTVQQVQIAGSLRRMRETVGDIDLVVAADDSSVALDAFAQHPLVSRVLARGTTKCSVEFQNGLRAQVWVFPPTDFGSAWQYATGSQAHNVSLREYALKRGYSLSEHGLSATTSGEVRHFATEAELYQALGLPWIAPELREGRGEIAAAAQGALPNLIQPTDLQADLHTHSTWSDGKGSIREMAFAAAQRGLRVLAITDHSYGLAIVQGVSPADLAAQRAEIEAVQRELDLSFGAGRLLLLHGIELEIKADGTLDFSDEVLASLDLVVASVHVGLRQPRAQITARLLNAIHNPHVDIIGHPSGRLLPDREPSDIDWEQIFAAARRTGVALEINANARRLDLNDVHARRAQEMGILLSVNTDAHRVDQLARSEFGVATARRAWLQSAQVINTWDPVKLRAWLQTRGSFAASTNLSGL